MFRKSRASSSPTSPSTGNNGSRDSPSHDEISDDYEVVETPSGSNHNSIPSSQRPRRMRSYPSPPTPGGVTPPPHAVRQASSPDDWYPSWLPRRPPPPGPASTVPSEMGHGTSSPVPFMSSPSNAGTTRGGRPTAGGVHRVTPSYDTGYTGYTEGESGEYVDIGEYDEDVLPGEGEGADESIGVGRRQTPRSVRIISGGTAAGSSHRQASSRHSRRASVGVSGVRSRKEGRASGHVHGTGPKPWWRGTASTPLSPTVFSSSPFPGRFAPDSAGTPVPSAVPPHMKAYIPHVGMPDLRGSHGFPVVGIASVQPRFRAPNLDLGILRSPSAWMKLLYILCPVWVYGLVVLQTFFDLNSIYCLLQIAIHPTPLSPPSSTSSGLNTSSRRNWTFGATVYGICWLFWIIGVVLLYEVVYCWWRLWRGKRPLIMQLYFSAPAYNIVCLTSYINFCFFRHIRSSARPPFPLPRFLRACGSSSSASSTAPSGRAATPSALSAVIEARDSQQREREVSSPITAEDKETIHVIPSTSIPNPVLTGISGSSASWDDWIAETCYFYGQNLPTVALLLPRAALCLALILAYSSAQPEDIALASLGRMQRDRTFFRADGSLSGYARGVLWTNVAWAVWRVTILLLSWLGLWWMSGQMCAGICGPRFRWEEPEEKPGYGAGYGEEELAEPQGVLATWGWRECTRARVFDAYDLCMSPPPTSTRAQEKQRDVSDREKSVQRVGGAMDEEEENAVLDRVLAAAGLPTVPPPARRAALCGELFNTPPEIRRELSAEEAVQEIIIPAPATKEGPGRKTRDRSPPNITPYPFMIYPARTCSQDPVPHPQAHSEEKIPFPPSPRTSKHSDREGAGHEEEGEEEFNDEEDDEIGLGVEEPSSGRASGSMSSLGQQIPSRFPFQFRHVTRRSRGGRSSIGTSQTQQSRSTSNKTSSASYGASRASRQASIFERRRESQDSTSPWSQSQISESAAQSPISPQAIGSGSSGFGSPVRVDPGLIPMPPQHTRRTRRQRASLPTLPVSVLPPAFSDVYNRARAQSDSTEGSRGFGPHPLYESSSDEGEVNKPETGVKMEEDEGMMTDPEPEGSQEEAEREDSVGLLSGGPSPRSSLGGARNISLTNLNLGIPHSYRSRHSSASSHSNSRSSGSRSASLSGSGSRAPSARSRSVSAQARSRAQSLIQSIGAASRSNISSEIGMRSRANSLARFSEVGSVHRNPGESAAASASGTSNVGSPTQLGNPEDYTFGQPIRLRIDSPEASENERSQELPEARETEAVPARMVRDAHSNISELAPSEHSQQTVQQDVSAGLQVPAPAFSSSPMPISGPRPLHEGPSFISSANESLITRPTYQEGSSDTAGRTPSTYGTVIYEPEHVHGQGGGWGPA